jgi:hypothetical protein
MYGINALRFSDRKRAKQLSIRLFTMLEVLRQRGNVQRSTRLRNAAARQALNSKNIREEASML